MKRAICSELFGDTDFRSAAVMMREYGFGGVEIAPHTIYGDFSGNVNARTAEIRRVLDGEGLSFAGLHWLLVGPEGLRVSSRDSGLNRRSWDHIRRLADISAELGGGPMTLGSPSQRSSGGIPAEEARGYFIEGLKSVAGHVEAAGCRLLVEALPSGVTDLVNTLAEAREVIDAVGSPGVGGMFDFHNTGDESEEWDELIRGHLKYIAHVHLNDPKGDVPAAADRLYRDAFRVLNESSYDGWVSLEIFSVPADPGDTLRQTGEFLDEIEESLS